MTASITKGSMRTVGEITLKRLEPVVILAALITIPLTVVEINGQNGVAYQVADWTIWGVFLADYLLGLVLAEGRRRYVMRAWLGLVVVVVSFPLLPSSRLTVRKA